MRNVPPLFVKLMAGRDGTNASLLKFNIPSDVVGKRARRRSAMKNKNNDFKFFFCLSVQMFLFFHRRHPGASAVARLASLSC